MATPALVVDEEAVFDAPLDGLLGCLHHLCRHDGNGRSKENSLWEKAWIFLKTIHVFNSEVVFH